MDAVAVTRPWESLPGPRRWPVVGNALQIDRHHMHLQLERWAQEYGVPYMFNIATRRFVVVADPDTIAKVLRDRPDGFRRPSRIERISREFGFLGLFSANGDTWKRQRPMVLGSFDPTHIKAFFPALVDVTERLARRWQRAASGKQTIDLQADLMRYTVDVTAGLAFGEDINTLEAKDDESIQRHLNHVLPALVRRALSPWDLWKLWPSKADREIGGHLAQIRVAVQSFIAKTRAKLDADPQLRDNPQNLIQAMVALRDKDAGLSDDDVSGNVLTMLLAGEDTTANTLAWMTWLLARNPDALARAQAEAREVLKGATCPQSQEQLAQLDWIDACANEAMRLKPVAPLIFNEAVRPTIVEGVPLQRGEIVVCLMRAPSLNEQLFASASEFRPQRWIAGEGAAANTFSSAKRVVMPFGAGPRMCPGRYLALAEIKMCAAMLLANFEIEFVGTDSGAEPQEEIALTMYPVGLRMRLSLRA
ncbi:MAG TPA: cytochrome P450 [Ramlibacter sp.]|nr:cytochrome P450 [Ramlibacter sp.]